MPGLNDPVAMRETVLAQVGRADLLLWVASATQPARQTDRKALDEVRAWTGAQRRAPPILLALTHIDQLRPAAEWSPPYNVTMPLGAKAKTIRAAMDSVAATLDMSLTAIVPVAIPPGQPPYNVDAIWARVAAEIDEAKLVQLERLRAGQSALSLRELAVQVANSGRILVKAALDI
jgi:predicted GTPase